MDDDSETIRAASDRLDSILQALASHADPHVRQQADDVVGLLMSLQGVAFQRILTLAADPAAGGPALVGRIAEDPLIGPLLLVHGIHPYGIESRVSRRLEQLRG